MTYTVGESFRPKGLALLATYSDQTTQRVTEGFAFTPSEPFTEAGEQAVTVTYEGASAVLYVTVSPGVINPYETVSWSDCKSVVSVSHAHCDLNGQLQANAKPAFAHLAQTAEHLAISNYYPSVPTYPLDDYEADYGSVPDGVIGSPNAEHICFGAYPRMHINSLGSFFSSGNGRTWNGTGWDRDEPIGVGGESWPVVFRNILNELQFSDGGGITVNHPKWSQLSAQDITPMLDFDSRVLGIEIFNDSCRTDTTTNEDFQMNTGWALDLWDEILLTGRRCWGFCVPDHRAESGAQNGLPWYGRNILLVPAKTERDCLKAYRDGAFYSKLGTSDLAFTGISLENGVLTVTADGASAISVIIDGVPYAYTEPVRIPESAVYVRVEAVKTDGASVLSGDGFDGTYADRIFSNPIILKPLSTT